MRFASVIAVVVALAGPASAAAKEPPSFALWTARWAAQNDRAVDKVMTACIKVYGEKADAKVGACFARTGLGVLLAERPKWERQVAAIAKGQSHACKKAIHSYWLASRKGQAASVIYFRGHPDAALTEIASDFREEPYAELDRLTDVAKAKAIRVCG